MDFLEFRREASCTYSCDNNLREALELPQGSQVSFPIARGIAGLFLNHCRGIGPHLKLRRETQGSLSCAWDLGVTIEFQHGNQALPLVEAWICAFLPSCKMGVRSPVELRWGNLGFLEMQQGSQTSVRVVRVYLGFHFSRSSGTGPHLELRG